MCRKASCIWGEVITHHLLASDRFTNCVYSKPLNYKDSTASNKPRITLVWPNYGFPTSSPPWSISKGMTSCMGRVIWWPSLLRSTTVLTWPSRVSVPKLSCIWGEVITHHLLASNRFTNCVYSKPLNYKDSTASNKPRITLVWPNYGFPTSIVHTLSDNPNDYWQYLRVDSLKSEESAGTDQKLWNVCRHALFRWILRTKSSFTKDGLPLRASSCTLSCSSLNIRTHFLTMPSVIALSPYVWQIWWWISLGSTFLALKKNELQTAFQNK